MLPLNQFSTIIFDCDGVLLDSNRLKTEAFRGVARHYFGDAAADDLVRYHMANGGVSRQVKFDYLLAKGWPFSGRLPSGAELSDEFGARVLDSLHHAPVAAGLDQLRELLVDSRWMVASGGNEVELRDVFLKKGILSLFDLGVYGNPTPKAEILRSKILDGTIILPAVYIGDSRLDHVVAQENGLEFCFVSAWTEFSDWENYCARHAIPNAKNIIGLFERYL